LKKGKMQRDMPVASDHKFSSYKSNDESEDIQMVNGRSTSRSPSHDNRYHGDAGVFEALEDKENDETSAALSDPNRPVKCEVYVQINKIVIFFCIIFFSN
jgi:hypothetical protein